MANYRQDFGTVGGLAVLFLPSTMAACSDYITLLPSNNTSQTIQSTLSLQSAIIMLVCFGTFVIVLSYLFNVIRKFVYQDKVSMMSIFKKFYDRLCYFISKLVIFLEYLKAT